MEKLVSPAHSANTTAYAVEGFFLEVVIEKIADAAEVVAEADAARFVCTHLCDRLAQIAAAALNLSNGMPVQLVRYCSRGLLALLFRCVVAEAAPERLPATRRNKLAPPAVVLTPTLW
mmetsp:Transcript_75071/g.122016  ORF Transcript_75071/g.122016 Transcript_75071/m.122016 type:complete len:118 (+) Transcript_75071:473-826(+)